MTVSPKITETELQKFACIHFQWVIACNTNFIKIRVGEVVSCVDMTWNDLYIYTAPLTRNRIHTALLMPKIFTFSAFLVTFLVSLAVPTVIFCAKPCKFNTDSAHRVNF
jgi:hypothetical protein